MKPLKALISKSTIKRAHAGVVLSMFSKSNFTCGTIVGFEDGTLGVYVDDQLSKYIEDKFDFVFITDHNIILTYDSKDKEVCYFDLIDYTDDLKYNDRAYHEYDIVIIYDRVLKENEIKNFTENFYKEIHKIVKGMKYIER